MSDNISADSNASNNSRKHWKDHEVDELRLYCQSNWDKRDCSFKLRGSKEAVESFQWMLCDISPKLKEILSTKENQAKGCKEIFISEPYFKYILSYAHKKKLEIDPADDIDFITLYEVVRKYEVDELAKMVIEVTKECGNVHEINWIDLFKITKIEYPYDDGWKEYFEQVMTAMSLRTKNWWLKNGIKSILTLDVSTFAKFFDYILRAQLKPINCFHAAEIYLSREDVFKKYSKSIFDPGRIQTAFFKSYIRQIQFDKMSFEELEEVFKSSFIKKIYSD